MDSTALTLLTENRSSPLQTCSTKNRKCVSTGKVLHFVSWVQIISSVSLKKILIFSALKSQALYYWLRTYLLERRDVASKSEASRMAMTQQRMQQAVSGASTGSIGLADGNVRVQSHGAGALSSDNQVHQATQSGDGGNSHGQEPERSTGVDSSVHAGNDQSLQQSSSNINDGGQSALRRSGALGLVASAASAFDAAKDIMEALRSKHTNLASELEVIVVAVLNFFIVFSMQYCCLGNFLINCL